MNRGEYIDYLHNMFQKNFSIERNIQVMGQKLECYGKWSMNYGRSVLTKKNIVDKYTCNEYCLIGSEDILTEKKLMDFIDYLKKGTTDLVEVNKEHKSSYVTGILVVDKIENINIKKKISKFSYLKNYKFSFHGWSEVRLAIVDIGEKDIYSNRASKELVKNLYFNKQ